MELGAVPRERSHHQHHGPRRVPTLAYRNGDFSQLPIYLGIQWRARPGQGRFGNLSTRSGHTINSGTIFDPTSATGVVCSAAVPTATCVTQGDVGNLYTVKNPFPQNMVPQTAAYMDPVAQKILALVPNSSRAQRRRWPDRQYHFKYPDPATGLRKFHLSRSINKSVPRDMCPFTIKRRSRKPNTGRRRVWPRHPIDPALALSIYAPTVRFNYDQNPHAQPPDAPWLGYTLNQLHQRGAGSLTATASYIILGLVGATVARNFPEHHHQNVLATGSLIISPGTGGNQSTGTTEHRPMINWNVNWVKRNHSFKLGAEWRYEQYPSDQFTGTNGQYTFGGGTVQPALQGFTTSQGSTGFPFADFLMGNVSLVGLLPCRDYSIRKIQVAMFVQDTWKLTRKLTLDYGIRWDYGTYGKEQYGRVANFDPNVLNPSAGNHPGGNIFEATCGCQFAQNYPFAVGPRFGFAYQIDRKTVFRGGFGVVYAPTSLSLAGAPVTSVTSSALPLGQYFFQLQNGIPSSIKPSWPSFLPNVGYADYRFGPWWLDRNSGRLKQNHLQGIQREISRNLVMEVSTSAIVGQDGLRLETKLMMSRRPYWPSSDSGSTRPVRSCLRLSGRP